MRLVIAEKPSVARTIAGVLGANNKNEGFLEGNDWTVSWCFGHLAEYAPPDSYDERYTKWNFGDLPIIPDNWKMEVSKDGKAQFNILKKLLNRTDIDYVVNACDAGREGELIFNDVYTLSGSHMPVKRLWVSSMEDSAIQTAFNRMRDGSQYDNLREAAICRSKADWLVGMNGTRAYTTKYKYRLTVGRVQTPTLAMIVERQKKIDNFVKEPYWTVSLTSNGLTVTSGQLQSKQDADKLTEVCQGQNGTIKTADKQKKKTQPPRLYDLTTLQRDANRVFGYTAQKTLDIAQNLYENKLITYPRTDSQYITDDMQDTIAWLIKKLPENVPCLNGVHIGNNIIRNVNNSKVTDHTALLPTRESINHGVSDQPEENQNIYRLICIRLAEAVSDDCIYEDTQVTVDCEGHEFKARGKKILSQGYRAIESAFKNALKSSTRDDNEDTDTDADIPDWVKQGANMPNVTAKSDEHMTSPPRPYTEDTLLSAMETAGNKEFEKDTEKKGLGTPATRASIIERLIKGNYIKRKGKTLIPTDDGKALIEVVTDSIKSASMTAEWENQLMLMEKGRVNPTEWLNGIIGFVNQILDECRAIPESQLGRFYQPKEEDVLGVCPVCGSPVVERKPCFGCTNRECKFALWKDNKFLESMKKKIDKTTAKKLLKDGRCHMTGLYSKKTGKKFDADLVMSINDKGYPQFNLEFDNSKKKSAKT